MKAKTISLNTLVDDYITSSQKRYFKVHNMELIVKLHGIERSVKVMPVLLQELGKCDFKKFDVTALSKSIPFFIEVGDDTNGLYLLDDSIKEWHNRYIGYRDYVYNKRWKKKN